MSGPSLIEWTERTWNPTRGCTRLSQGCRNCYAEGIAARFSGPGLPYEGLASRTPAGPRWTGKLAFSDKALLEPLKRRAPTTYFVNSMSDLFHEKMPDEWIDRVFAVMALCPQHTFQVLTKRPERMRRWSKVNSTGGWIFHVAQQVDPKKHGARSGKWPLPNVWLGVSTEDQATADERIPHLLATPAAIRFVSAEPLLGPISFRDLPVGGHHSALCIPTAHDRFDALHPRRSPRLDWIIVGGESGLDSRPMHPAWARSIRDQCAAAGAAFFFKQHGDWLFEDQIVGDQHPSERFFRSDGSPVDDKPPFGPESGRLWHWWNDGGFASIRVGKKFAGRLLDGREHNGMPAVRA